MKISLVFFGSGPVAAKSLELLANKYHIEAVITKPKPSHHRGDFPVVTLVESLGLKTYYASTKSELSELFATKPVTSQLGIVIDYGVIIGQDVIDYFPLGIINSHFSLLPEWRGADPITFSILSGQKNTGVSLMLINQKLDEGEILAEGVYDLPGDITTPKLTDGLIELSDALLDHYLPMYVDGEVKPVSQETAARAMNRPYLPTYSRKLSKADGLIDWQKPAEQIEREIRGFIDWPRSYTTLAGKDVIICAAHIDDAADDLTIGQAKATDDKQLVVRTSDKLLVIDELKPAGKKIMTAKQFLAGYGKDL